MLLCTSHTNPTTVDFTPYLLSSFGRNNVHATIIDTNNAVKDVVNKLGSPQAKEIWSDEVLGLDPAYRGSYTQMTHEYKRHRTNIQPSEEIERCFKDDGKQNIQYE